MTTVAPQMNRHRIRRHEREQEILTLAARAEGVTYDELKTHFHGRVSESAVVETVLTMRQRGLLNSNGQRYALSKPRVVFRASAPAVPPLEPVRAQQILRLFEYFSPLTTRQVALALGIGPKLAAVHLHSLRLAGRLQPVPWSGREALLTRRHGHAYALADEGLKGLDCA